MHERQQQLAHSTHTNWAGQVTLNKSQWLAGQIKGNVQEGPRRQLVGFHGPKAAYPVCYTWGPLWKAEWTFERGEATIIRSLNFKCIKYLPKI